MSRSMMKVTAGTALALRGGEFFSRIAEMNKDNKMNKSMMKATAGTALALRGGKFFSRIAGMNKA